MKINSLLILILLSQFLLGCGSGQLDDNTNSEGADLDTSADTRKTILFFGNSLTAGYGVEEEEAFPALIQQKIDSLGIDYKVINGGLSGETSASGLSRIDWFLEDSIDIFFLELGGNDGLRGIPLDETKRNLKLILDKVRQTYSESKLILAGMEIPPNMGADYTAEFRQLYPRIASSYDDIVLIPFMLEGVGGNPELNLPDGIHPTVEGHKIVAENIWPYLKDIIVN